jgi:MoaA/NifB/PqqE/SkfB family radical SAM enzyme
MTSLGQALNFIRNVLRLKYGKSRFFYPVMTSFYITTRCNLKCSYCLCSGMKWRELDTERTFKILEKIRPGNPGLAITGGETLIRPDLIEILRRAKQLRFSPLSLTTNALLLDKSESALQYADYLIISLDSVNAEKWDAVLGVRGAAVEIISNIQRYKMLEQKYRYRMILNCVVTSSTIDDVYGVLEFCRNLDVPLGIVPQNNWTVPDKDLISNPAYYKLVRDVIAMKQNGYRIGVSDLFLWQILTFPEHNCYPSLVPKVYPDGSLFFPCRHLNRVYGNILDYPSLVEMMKEAYQREGLPECSSDSQKCFMSCYLEFANALEHPDSLWNLWKRFKPSGTAVPDSPKD